MKELVEFSYRLVRASLAICSEELRSDTKNEVDGVYFRSRGDGSSCLGRIKKRETPSIWRYSSPCEEGVYGLAISSHVRVIHKCQQPHNAILKVRRITVQFHLEVLRCPKFASGG